MNQKKLLWCTSLCFLSLIIYAWLLTGALSVLKIWQHAMTIQNPSYPLQRKSKQQDVLYDQRSPIEAYLDLIHESPNAVTSLSPSLFAFQEESLVIQERPIQPLGGVSQEITLGGSEMGVWQRFTSDEHGFRNPKNIYTQAPIDILVLGDSFALGGSVKDGETIPGRLRSKFPLTINLGYNDNGPLMELASLREFGEWTRPKRVIWLYYEGNDISGISAEFNSPILARYLDDRFRQNIKEIQPEIDKTLRLIVKMRLDKFQKHTKLMRIIEASQGFPDVFQDILRFRELRRAIGISQPLSDVMRYGARPDQIIQFRQVTEAIQKECKRINARLMFVYLPEWFSFTAGERQDRKVALSIIRSLGISLVDGLEVFRGNPDPLSLFPLRTYAHYTPEGYKAIADAILNRFTMNK